MTPVEKAILESLRKVLDQKLVHSVATCALIAQKLQVPPKEGIEMILDTFSKVQRDIRGIFAEAEAEVAANKKGGS